jgi:hypothetical protein
MGAEPRIIARSASSELHAVFYAWSSVRQRVEQLISRVVRYCRKNNPRLRGRQRVTLWVQLGYLLLLFVGLMAYRTGELDLALCPSPYFD